MNMNETIQSELINAYDLLDNQAALERIRAIYDENREAINQSRDLLILYHLALPKLLLRNYQVPESTKSYEELFMRIIQDRSKVVLNRKFTENKVSRVFS